MANELTILEHSTLPPAVKEDFERLLIAIASGKTVAQAAVMEEETLALLLLRYPEVKMGLEEARKVAGYLLEQKALDVAHGLWQARNSKGLTSNTVAATRLLIEQLRWSAEKAAPEV